MSPALLGRANEGERGRLMCRGAGLVRRGRCSREGLGHGPAS
ncbi:hypothetical protein DB31_0388 [Hyalangium minutum]|uniref:Uncharacterized protein n=1 Tax=Hyalangium minutum TaxID=394096 RepID=A0A085WWR4_9BACT|nr:hypothetical protein DB31_0388 [Hyalangium minutum]